MYVDLDGTLTDFEGAVRRLGGTTEEPGDMWGKIAKVPDFFSSLSWLSDGQELWQALLTWQPVVLTGLPSGCLRRRAEEQKRAWCRKHLGPDVAVLCVDARDKPRYSSPGSVLVDDNEQMRGPWEKPGGRFVLRRDARSTAAAVRQAMEAVSVPLSRAVVPEVLFSAVFLSDASRAKLLARCPPQHGRVHAEHVTIEACPKLSHVQALPLGESVALEVLGEVSDTRGHAVGVRILHEGLQQMCASGCPHITVATALGVAPVYSQELLKREPTTPVELIKLQLDGQVGVKLLLGGDDKQHFAAEAMLPSSLQEQVEAFVAGASGGEQLQLGDLGVSVKRAVHDFAAGLGLEVSAGKRRNGKSQVQLAFTAATESLRALRPTRHRVVISGSELQELGFVVEPGVHTNCLAAVDSFEEPPGTVAAESAKGRAEEEADDEAEERVEPGVEGAEEGGEEEEKATGEETGEEAGEEAAEAAEEAEELEERDGEEDLPADKERAGEAVINTLAGLESNMSASLTDAALVAFVQRLLLTEEQSRRRSELVASISRALAAVCGSTLEAVLVGSSGAGLVAGSSDLDLALVPTDLRSAEMPAGLRGEAEAAADDREKALLQQVSRALERTGMRDVQVVVTRSVAPSLVKCMDANSGTHCDIVVRHGTGGAVASVDKAAALRSFGAASRHFRPLALLVKQWAKLRQLVAPTAGKLNSFSWTLMAAFFMQTQGLLPPLDCSTEALRGRRWSAALPELLSDDLDLAGLAPVLLGFFAFWREFPFHAACASLRRGQWYDAKEAPPAQDGAPHVLLLEDPVEPDENTARTLTQRHLEELRAEVNRAHLLLQRGHPWEDVCRVPHAKKQKELKAFYLPEQLLMPPNDRGGTLSLPDMISGAAVPEAVKAAVRSFVESSPCGEWHSLPLPLSGAERRSVHHLANLCGIQSKRSGRQQDGKYQLRLCKPLGWAQQKTSGQRPTPQSHAPERAKEEPFQREPLVAVQQPQAPVAITDCAPLRFEPHSRLKVVKMLRDDVPLERLQQRYKLIVRWHPRLPLVQLSYNQTESHMASPVVQECRGLILERGTWNVAAWPFEKFFNHGERYAKPLDWSSGAVRVYEKVDGSLMVLYWCEDTWHVATSKLPAGDGLFSKGSTITFAELFWQVWCERGYTLPSDRKACYMFELTTPLHTIIVRHRSSRLVCLGGRDLCSLEEISCERLAEAHGWEVPRRFDPELSTLQQVETAARALNPVVQEGFVVVDQHFHRLKIKSPSYVALHHMGGNADRGGSSGVDEHGRLRSLVQIARCNEGDEFLAYYPELTREFHEVLGHWRALLRELDLGVQQGTAGQAGAQTQRFMKRMRQEGCSAMQVLQEARIQELEVALEEPRLELVNEAVLVVEPQARVDRRRGKENSLEALGEGQAGEDAAVSDVETCAKPSNRFCGLLDESSGSEG